MREYDYILFDLDGTITDPGIGITNSVMHALKQFDIEVADRSELYKFIGPPLADSFHNFYGIPEDRCKDAIAFYRQHYVPVGMFENELYEGILHVFAELKQCGKKVIMATSKPEEFAVKIAKHFSFYEYFDCIAGATLDERVVTKIEVMEMAIKRMQISDMSKAVMIGDREYDMLGAKHFGMDAIGVTYGYGSRQELEASGAKAIVDKPLDLLQIL